MTAKVYFFWLVCFVPLFNGLAQVKVLSGQKSVGSTVNSPYDEECVILSPDGQQLFFTRKFHPGNVGGEEDPADIWVSSLSSDSTWSVPVNLSEINTAGLNQMIGFMDRSSGKILVIQDHRFLIYQEKESDWYNSDELIVKYFKNKGKHFSASVSLNGKMIFFGMESFGGYGVEDLYFSKSESDGSWSTPKSLGSVINTENQEIFPFLAADHETLFFSSNGHEGYGSFDLFMSKRLDDTWQNWSEPVNLGSQINSKGLESSFTLLDGAETAVLISTQNSDGYGDIKTVKIENNIKSDQLDSLKEKQEEILGKPAEKHCTLSGVVKDALTGSVIVGAEIRIEMSEGGSYKGLANSEGKFLVQVPEADEYEVLSRAFEYMSAELIVTKAQVASEEPLEFILNPIVEGNTISLEHVLFVQGKNELLLGSEDELDLVVEMMKYNPDIHIFLAGHTDNQGKASLNLELSKERVKVVEEYLKSHGISSDRISGRGYGGMKPRASNASAESRKLNRRVEFTIHRKQ